MTRIAVWLVLAGSLWGAPDFSGEWKLDPSAGERRMALQEQTLSVAHKEPELRVRVDTKGGPVGDVVSELKYAVDGKEHVNKVLGSDFRSTLDWTGETLRIRTVGDYLGSEVRMVELWVMKAGVLEVRRTVSTSNREVQETLVYRKQ